MTFPGHIMSWRVGLAFLMLLSSAGMPRTGEAQDARALLGRSLEAFGGAARIRAISSVVVTASGTEYREAESQGFSPDEMTPTSHEETIAVDVAGRRASNEVRSDRHDGSARWRRFAYDSAGRNYGDFIARQAVRTPMARAPGKVLEQRRRIPPFLLLEAFDNPAHVRLLGDSVAGGQRHHVLAYDVPDRSATVRLFLEHATYRLTRTRQTIDFPGLGDASVEYEFLPHAAHQALRVYPRGHVVRLNGAVLQRVSYTSVLVDDTAALRGAFELPDDMHRFFVAINARQAAAAASVSADSASRQASVSGTAGPRPRQSHVHVIPIGNGDNGLVVEFADFVLVAEPSARHPVLTEIPVDDRPGSTSIAEAFITRVKELVPNKPIRYVVASHHHGDHAGGVRAFLAEGATVLTTRSARPALERAAQAPTTAIPDRFARQPSSVRIETVTGRRVISDGSQAVELIDIGPNPHTDEMLAVYLPRRRMIFQADLFYFSGESRFPERGRLVAMKAFAEWLLQSGLQVDSIMGTHMAAAATIDHVRRSLTLADRPADTRLPAHLSRRIPADSLREDLALARRALHEAHPGVYRYSSADRVDSAFARAARSLGAGATQMEFHRVLATAICTIGDGHTSVAPGAELRDLITRQVPVLPVTVHVSGRRVFVLRDLERSGGDLRGSEILSVNGRPTADLMEELERATCVDGVIPTARARRIESRFATMLYEVAGVSAPFTLEVADTIGRRSTVRRGGFSSREVARRMREEFPQDVAVRAPVDLTMLDAGRIARLTIRTFDDVTDPRSGRHVSHLIRDALDSIARSRARSVILDLRDNGGGLDSLGHLVLSRLVPDSVRYYTDIRLNALEFSFVARASGGIQAPAGFLAQGTDGKYHATGHPNWGIEAPGHPQLSGSVFVLMNGRSFSTTGELLSHLHARNRAVFIGEESGGGYTGNTAGWTSVLTLPASGARVSIPLLSYVLGVAPPAQAGRGVRPTHEIQYSVRERLDGVDKEMALALELARRSRAGAPR